MKSDEIIIGSERIQVPAGYKQAEAEYCQAEQIAFDMAVAKQKRKFEIDPLREAVRTKRLKFYELWHCGFVELPTPDPTNNPKSFWNKVLKFLYE